MREYSDLGESVNDIGWSVVDGSVSNKLSFLKPIKLVTITVLHNI
jgi:hypothetical protein